MSRDKDIPVFSDIQFFCDGNQNNSFSIFVPKGQEEHLTNTDYLKELINDSLNKLYYVGENSNESFLAYFMRGRK